MADPASMNTGTSVAGSLRERYTKKGGWVGERLHARTRREEMTQAIIPIGARNCTRSG